MVDALRSIDLDILPGSITAIVGESGSGKSTLGTCLALQEKASQGEVWFEGTEVSNCSRQQLTALRPKIQIVFQDSAGAFNPFFSAEQIVAEPLEIQHRASSSQLAARARELMEEVGVPADWANRRALEFSGGQRQRLAIARAIALNPTCLILDESLSGLDLSTQAQILNLLLDLRDSRGLTCLLISHDLTLVGQIADSVVVMHSGHAVEQGSMRQIMESPQHSQTRALLHHASAFDSAFRSVSAGAGR